MDELVLRLTANEVNAVLYSLGKQPYEAVAGVIGKINAQAMAQIQEHKDHRMDNDVRECPADCPAKGSGALAHVENSDCVWRGVNGDADQEEGKSGV